jgi:hypothetical protein
MPNVVVCPGCNYKHEQRRADGACPLCVRRGEIAGREVARRRAMNRPLVRFFCALAVLGVGAGGVLAKEYVAGMGAGKHGSRPPAVRLATFHGHGVSDYCIPEFPPGWSGLERTPAWDRFNDQILVRPDGSAKLIFASFRPSQGEPVDLSRFYADVVKARSSEPEFKLVDEPKIFDGKAFHALVSNDGRALEEGLWVKAKDDRVYVARLLATRGTAFADEWQKVAPLLARFETNCFEAD